MSRRYLLKRLGGSLLTLLGVAVLVFIILRLIPGDEITGTLGIESGVLTDAQRAALEQYFGIDKPLSPSSPAGSGTFSLETSVSACEAAPTSAP